jgi:hypothetical protein
MDMVGPYFNLAYLFIYLYSLPLLFTARILYPRTSRSLLGHCITHLQFPTRYFLQSLEHHKMAKV